MKYSIEPIDTIYGYGYVYTIKGYGFLFFGKKIWLKV